MFGNERVFYGIIHGYPFCGFSLKKSINKIFKILRKISRMRVVNTFDVFFGLLSVSGWEGRNAGSQLLTQNANGPPIQRIGLGPELKEFGTHVVGGSAFSLPFLRSKQNPPALVCDLNGDVVVVDHDILRFEVSVQYVFGVDLVEGYYDLLHDVGRLLLTESAEGLSPHLVKQTTVRTLFRQHLHFVFV